MPLNATFLLKIVINLSQVTFLALDANALYFK